MKKMKKKSFCLLLSGMLAVNSGVVPVSAGWLDNLGVSIEDDGTIKADGDINIKGVTIHVDDVEITPEDIENGISYITEKAKTGDLFEFPDLERGMELAESALDEIQDLLDDGTLNITLSDFDDVDDPTQQDEDATVIDTSDSLIQNKAATSYYYSILDPEEQDMYQAMLTIAKFPDDTSIKASRKTSMDPSTDAFYDSFQKVYYALIYDHPELFWLNSSNMWVQYNYTGSSDENNQYDYILSLKGSYPEYRTQMSRFNQAVSQALASVDMSQSQAKIALQLHDYIINLATYDYPALDDSKMRITHTAYGILVENDHNISNTGVCDGYSYAYEYLLQQAGIESLIVCGMAGNSDSDTGRHAWNMVKLDGQWYEVDATWDDFEQEPNPNNDYYNVEQAALADQNFVNRQKHYLFNKTTDQIEYYTPDDNLTYYTSNGGWVTYTGSSVHHRHNSSTRGGIYDDLCMQVPSANGTTYTYDYIISH